jgi:tRNA/tmRNA/rRNA uracil-C5-methylase (TrmA/RlmC/RlmD family)
VGFVAGALPGEEVDAEVEEVRRSFWRGRAVAVVTASRDRILAPSEACPGCDWGHFEPSAAREAKRELFLETMQRIGKLPAETFGDLRIVPSDLAHRIRNRFHVEGRGANLVLGQFAGRSHRVLPIAGCRAITPQTAALLPSIRDALAGTDAALSELATLEETAGDRRLARATLGDISKRQLATEAESVGRALEPFFAGVKVVDREGRAVFQAGEARLALEVGARPFLVSVDSFFQGNRHLAATLLGDVGEAAQDRPGDALDAFGGVGFFAAALLDAGHSVTSVEGNPSAARDAAKTRQRWVDADRWRIVPSSVAGFLSTSSKRFDLVVVDPPRAGLARLALPVAGRARRRMVYVSCDPATLARDLAELRPVFEVVAARLYDLFPLTHRVESVVTLVRKAGAA